MLLAGCIVASEEVKGPAATPVPRVVTAAPTVQPTTEVPRPAATEAPRPAATSGAAGAAGGTPAQAAAQSPVARSPVADAGRGGRYFVQSGDTLTGVARRFGVSPSELATANQIPADSLLRTGQDLRLPAGVWSDSLAIRVTSPAPGATVRSPLTVEGTAATFESMVVVEVLGADGSPLAQTSVSASNPELGQHGPFRATVTVPAAGQNRAATLRLYWRSPRDGAPRDEVRIPLTIAASG